ncbi:uncharacterized protein BXZ73DRAFT_104556 [Epithele typhae]|uniref:uncharacterized protein n=1 Tax=Epithele typhae TaxID=378194 RepID=UPI002008AC7A|nr:uncharacterized protein BXZ73DRAFT_104556 [Epithele typhae]KAH9920822.1 hypothetical protein BXZ73DRAFT_104556 [Epithele typhae]
MDNQGRWFEQDQVFSTPSPAPYTPRLPLPSPHLSLDRHARLEFELKTERTLRYELVQGLSIKLGGAAPSALQVPQPPLRKADHLKVKFWYKHEWHAYDKARRAQTTITDPAKDLTTEQPFSDHEDNDLEGNDNDGDDEDLEDLEKSDGAQDGTTNYDAAKGDKTNGPQPGKRGPARAAQGHNDTFHFVEDVNGKPKAPYGDGEQSPHSTTRKRRHSKEPSNSSRKNKKARKQALELTVPLPGVPIAHPIVTCSWEHRGSDFISMCDGVHGHDPSASHVCGSHACGSRVCDCGTQDHDCDVRSSVTLWDNSVHEYGSRDDTNQDCRVSNVGDYGDALQDVHVPSPGCRRSCSTDTERIPKPKPRKGAVFAVKKDCFTARNLCGIDWLNDHPGGLSKDFNGYWQEVQKMPDLLKKYEDKRKACLEAAKAA